MDGDGGTGVPWVRLGHSADEGGSTDATPVDEGGSSGKDSRTQGASQISRDNILPLFWRPL